MSLQEAIVFQRFINQLSQDERIDRVVNIRAIEFATVDGAGAPRLALRLPTDEVVTLEDHALASRLRISPGALVARFIPEVPIDDLSLAEASRVIDGAKRTAGSNGSNGAGGTNGEGR